MWELQQKLLLKSAQSLQRGQTLVLVIDGADTLVDQNGQLISDWIPKSLPRVSVRPNWRQGCRGVVGRGTSLMLSSSPTLYLSVPLCICPSEYTWC